MLPFPASTTREEKLELIDKIKNRLLHKHGDNILAIGVYGSIALESDGPYSDIEIHVVTKDGTPLENHEFIFGKFKIEIGSRYQSELIKKARKVDDSWAIKAGSFINILSIYDPLHIFEELKKLHLQVSETSIRETMREFMIWEPYETMGKIRNNYRIKNLNYISLGANDLVWQTAKLIGLANKQYFSTRARTLEESLKMKLKPSGYQELVHHVMEGTLHDKDHLYILCEKLWSGLNEWYDELGIDYKTHEFPF